MEHLFRFQISVVEETAVVSSDEEYGDENSSSSCSDGEAGGVERFNDSPVVYKNKSHFRDNEEYAKYVRNKIQVEMMVRCCRSYEEVHERDIGKVIKVCIYRIRFLHSNISYLSGYFIILGN